MNQRRRLKALRKLSKFANGERCARLTPREWHYLRTKMPREIARAIQDCYARLRKFVENMTLELGP